MSSGMSFGWIGVDLDGTLAFYDKWVAHNHVGEPVPEMVERVKNWLEEGRRVKIFTARVSIPAQALEAQIAIQSWCLAHLGVALEVTCVKDTGMIELWDDRCVQVQKNTGEPMCDSPAGLT